MSIHIICPHCGQEGLVPDHFAGTRLRCRGCKAPFVPEAPEADEGFREVHVAAGNEQTAVQVCDEPGPAPEPAQAEAAETPTAPAKNRDVLIALSVVASLVLLVVAIWGWGALQWLWKIGLLLKGLFGG